MRVAKVFLVGLTLFFFSIHLAASGQDKDKKKAGPKKQATVFTDPGDAPIDYRIQGEYLSQKDQLGAQVVARGNGKFDIYLLEGGLPGAGWQPKSKKIKLEGKLDSDKSNVEVAGGSYKVTINTAAEKLHFEISADKAAVLKRVERKSPTLGAKPPEGAVILFDGKNADEWNEKKMVGDLLGVPNTTKRKFADFNLHIEFRTPFQPTAGGQGRGNSGVYLQGRYEIQVLDSFGLQGKDNECGGIYGSRAPNVNMCLPPLVWQTYDIEYHAGPVDPVTKKKIGPIVSVSHNGIVIHDQVELKGGSTPGPIHLQNHGNPVVYRNIWLVERK